MTILSIVKLPDPRLRQKTAAVRDFSKSILEPLIADFFETMHHERGVGLAANQVGVMQRIFIMDVSEDRNQPVIAINPEILNPQGECFENEGCLSVTGEYDKVKRFDQLTLRAQNISGEFFELNCVGLAAVCVQHEIDHLNGILFIDRLSKLKQNRIMERLKKRMS